MIPITLKSQILQLQNRFRHLLEPPPNLKKEFKLLSHQKEGLAWAQQTLGEKISRWIARR